jgi:hypothetical protein
MEIHLAGKTSKKRQNSDTSTPPACAQYPHATLNREIRRAPCCKTPPPNLLRRRRPPGKWMELENIVLSKVSQAQKIKNHMFSLTCGL